MNWRRGGFISERLAGVAIPLCVFGLLATLVSHLLDLRGVLIAGGEAKLRQATLAFAAGVILYERLIHYEGLTLAKPYGYALGGVMTLFALYHSASFRQPGPIVAAFVLTETLFALLWWAGHRVSAACSVNDERAVEEAAESGILRAVRLRLKPAASPPPAAGGKPEKNWAEKLTARHPGRVLLAFSLVALPLFGLGLLVFPPDASSRFRLGLMLFIYLWCALALLFLSSLRQLIVYFRRREVSLPELIGLPWLALGVLGVTLTLVAAFLLPQPPSPQNLIVREQIVDAAREISARRGVPSSAASQPDEDPLDPKKVGWSKDNIGRFNQRYTQTDRLKDPFISYVDRNRDIEAEARTFVVLSAAVNDSFSKLFHLLLKGIIGLALVSAVILVLGTIYLAIQRLRQGPALLVSRIAKLVLREGRKKDRTAPPSRRRFVSFGDPFADPALQRDLNALVRTLWEAMLAWCADAGSPCSADLTPLEFVESAPAALRGFERSARFIARLFTFSEFSSQSVPEATLPELRQFWLELRRHAGG